MKDKDIDWKKYDKKYFHYHLKFNKKDNDTIEELFKKSKEKKITTFIKKIVLFGSSSYKEKELLYNKTIKSNEIILKQLSKIGNNLNQITIKLHLNNSFSETEKRQLFENINELKQTIYSKL